MNGKLILIASALIAVLAIIAAGTGLLTDLYKNDTTSGAAQQRGNDLVVLVLCVPLLLVSALFAAKGSLRGRLVWTGTVFFFLYTYASHVVPDGLQLHVPGLRSRVLAVAVHLRGERADA